MKKGRMVIRQLNDNAKDQRCDAAWHSIANTFLWLEVSWEHFHKNWMSWSDEVGFWSSEDLQGLAENRSGISSRGEDRRFHLKNV